MIGFILGRIFFFFLLSSFVGVDDDGVIAFLVVSVAAAAAAAAAVAAVASFLVGCEVFADLGVRSKTSILASCGCFIGLICGVAMIGVSTSLVDYRCTLLSVDDRLFSSSSSFLRLSFLLNCRYVMNETAIAADVNKKTGSAAPLFPMLLLVLLL